MVADVRGNHTVTYFDHGQGILDRRAGGETEAVVSRQGNSLETLHGSCGNGYVIVAIFQVGCWTYSKHALVDNVIISDSDTIKSNTIDAGTGLDFFTECNADRLVRTGAPAPAFTTL